jgi:hypothetical protein
MNFCVSYQKGPRQRALPMRILGVLPVNVVENVWECVKVMQIDGRLDAVFGT